MKRFCVERLASAIAVGALFGWSSSALAQNTESYVDVSAGVGYATNPYLLDDDTDSGFGRLSAYASYRRATELFSTTLSAFVENTTYLEDYGSKQVFDLAGHTQYQASQKVRVFGQVNVTGDIAGQLSNRFLTVPLAPEVPDPTDPLSVTVDDPDFFGFRGRQFRTSGQIGAAITTSERSSVTFSGGAQRNVFSEDFIEDFTVLFANGAYDRLLSERTAVGGRLNLWRTEYDGGSDRTTVINPEITGRTRLGENLDASGAVGLIFAHQERQGLEDWSTNLSWSGSLCRASETERLCGNVSRDARNSISDSLTTTTSAGVDWFKRLDEVQTLQLTASVSHYGADDIINNNSDAYYYRTAGNYDRKLGSRISVGANVGVRALRLDGPDPNTDVSGSAYARYRFGDLLR